MRYINIPVFIPQAGCPFQCIFCSQQQIVDQAAIPDVPEVTRHIETCLPTLASDAEVEVAFFGGTFTALPADDQIRYLEAAAACRERSVVQGIRLSTRPDCIDPTVLERLQSYGVTTIELGVQSMHDEVLACSRRGYRACDVIEACRLVKQYGFRLGIQLMVGLPADSRLRSLYSALGAVKLQADMIRIYPTLVLSDTLLARWWREGRYRALSLEEAVAVCADMLLIFQHYHIPVIRMGLQPSRDLCDPGTVLAGPFHPGFGELVEQRIFLEQAGSLLPDPTGTGMETAGWRLHVHPRDLSKMIGHRQSNVQSLARRYGLRDVRVAADAGMERNSVGFCPPGESSRMLVLTRQEYIGQLLQYRKLPVVQNQYETVYWASDAWNRKD